MLFSNPKADGEHASSSVEAAAESSRSDRRVLLTRLVILRFQTADPVLSRGSTGSVGHRPSLLAGDDCASPSGSSCVAGVVEEDSAGVMGRVLKLEVDPGSTAGAVDEGAAGVEGPFVDGGLASRLRPSFAAARVSHRGGDEGKSRRLINVGWGLDSRTTEGSDNKTASASLTFSIRDESGSRTGARFLVLLPSTISLSDEGADLLLDTMDMALADGIDLRLDRRRRG